MAVTLGSQLALTTLGHHFVFRLRGEFIKRILDTQIEQGVLYERTNFSNK